MIKVGGRPADVKSRLDQLGKWYWYLSDWLGWLPHLNIEGRVHLSRPAQAPAIGEGVAD